MAVLRVKQGRIKKKKHESLKVLPKDLVVEIFAKVASHSIADICKVKLCCKEFLHAAEDNYVYQHASMDKFALVPLQWFTQEKESSFLNRCRESGNLEILYREGMVQYFSSLMVKLGLENLKNAALKGHDEAKYVYCMLLMCGEDQEQRNLGFDLFRSLKTSTYVRRCRERVKSFINSMWMNNPVARNHHLSLCHSSTCKLQKLSKRLSSWVEDEDDGITCEYCNGDYELNIFCNMFRV
ncbi:putative F-box protein At1g67623 [Gastrolobium bilobum]|uniref:putative F-box protein At1g67623 n=1 Tax=Gastrolobium bilobum TaxID=150636 RepID=UPI002AB205C3|nr:putative F-box protein At1g67623 [Gastrolobium bilobum]